MGGENQHARTVKVVQFVSTIDKNILVRSVEEDQSVFIISKNQFARIVAEVQFASMGG